MVTNVNDWELSITDWKIKPHPPNVITSVAFQVTVWNIANVLRMTYDKVVTNASTFSYHNGAFIFIVPLALRR